MLAWIKSLWAGQGCVATAKSQPTLSPVESRLRSGSGGHGDCCTPPPAGSSSIDAEHQRMPDQAAAAAAGGSAAGQLHSRYLYSDGKARAVGAVSSQGWAHAFVLDAAGTCTRSAPARVTRMAATLACTCTAKHRACAGIIHLTQTMS